MSPIIAFILLLILGGLFLLVKLIEFAGKLGRFAGKLGRSVGYVVVDAEQRTAGLIRRNQDIIASALA
jgi:hypothetical protein